MNELRWILIGFGIVLLAGIYLWGRRAGAVVTEDGVLRGRPEPALQPHGFADAHREPEPVVAEEPAVNYETTAVRPAPARPEKRNFRAEAPVAESDEPPNPSFTRELPRSFSKEPPAV